MAFREFHFVGTNAPVTINSAAVAFARPSGGTTSALVAFLTPAEEGAEFIVLEEPYRVVRDWLLETELYRT